MTRSHRTWHIWFWILAAPLLALGLIAALADRPTPAASKPPLAAADLIPPSK